MTDENILHFKRYSVKETEAPTPVSNRLSELKNTLDQRLQTKLEREQAIESRRIERDMQIRRTIKKLITGLSTAILLSGLASAGWALAQKNNHLIQKDKEKLSLDYSQLKNRNQQLERENATLLAKLNTSEKNAQALDNLSTDLSKAVDQLKTNRTELIVKLDHANETIEQLYKDNATQAESFKTLSTAHQSLQITNAALTEKINLLQNIFEQGRNALSQSKPKQTASAKDG